MKELTWKHVAVIVSFFAAVVILSLAHLETGTFILLGLAVLGALGLAVAQTAGAKEQTTAVKEQTNGNWSAVLGILERQGHMLANSTPITPTLLPEVPPRVD